MNKLLAIALATICILCTFYYCPLQQQILPLEEEQTVQTDAPDWTQQQYDEYYEKNQIKPTNPDTTLTIELDRNDVPTHLAKRFPNYSSWAVSTNPLDISCVDRTYKGVPIDKGDVQTNVKTAKSLENITVPYIGCGRLALLCQMDFLGRYAGYSTIYAGTDFDTQEVALARMILTEMKGLSSDTAGTFVSPNEFYRATKEILQKYSLYSTDYNKETTFINVYGDTVFSTKSFSQKIIDINNSIDKGMPVIVWTGPGSGSEHDNYALHYLNIYGYEYWIGTDSSGNQEVHLMYRIAPNWNRGQDIYMDCDTLDFLSCGFFFFQELQGRICLTPEDYNLPCMYNNSVETKSIVNNNRITNITYLRTGYVNRYKSDNVTIEKQLLTLSSYRKTAGEAYIEYEFPSGIKFLTFDAALWSSNENITISNSIIEMQYCDKDGDWIAVVTPYLHEGKTISTNYKLPTKYTFNPNDTYIDQKFYPTKIRIIVKCFNPSGDRNKGRLVLGTINVRTI